MKPGEVVAGKYQIDRRLGIGGMGEVWSAIHLGTGRQFAVKFMHAHAATSASARQRFTREARASAKVNHPSVIDVFDVGEQEDGTLYLVMELLDGCSLGDAIHAVPPLTVQDFLTVMMETTEGITAAHAAGIVHRDLKPANIFLHRDRSGLASPKVLDFGISKFADADDFSTKTGAVLGSPRYMSPEQTRSAAAADNRADVWALGVILFEGLTGTYPHQGDSFTSLVISISTEPPKSIDVVAPMLPEHVRAIVRECLRPLDERLASAELLAMMLRRALEDPGLAQVTLPKPQHANSDPGKTTTGVRVKPLTPSSSSGLKQQPPLAPSSDPRLASGRLSAPVALPPLAPVASPGSGRHAPVGVPIVDPPTVSLQGHDPLSSSLATVNVETLAYEPRERIAEPPRSTEAPVLPPLPTTAGASANRLRWIAAVLSFLLAGIIVALVSTIRRTNEIDSSGAPSAGVAAPPTASPPTPSEVAAASSTAAPSSSTAVVASAAPSAATSATATATATATASAKASTKATVPAPPRPPSPPKPHASAKPDPGIFGSGLP